MSAAFDLHPLERGVPPDWASAWGEDRHGVWAAFSVRGVLHRLRWIRAGRFIMGSPLEEPGRWEDEGPRHAVVISRGFWLGATPCTQALWRAVTGENPSRFEGAERPVEQVSFTDVQAFLRCLGDLVPGLDPRLPSEAEWEYACRAGSEGAIYAPDRAAIAWFSRNSAGITHPVGQKAPNRWGLHDTLGNVDEWCLDGKRVYGGAEVVDPLGPVVVVASRAVRGGSWHDVAQIVRAAYRYAYHPSARYDDLGFRLARGQAGR